MSRAVTTHRAQLLQMITALGGRERRLVYLSVPITSGRRHFEHLKTTGGAVGRDWCADVKAANVREAQILAERLRVARPDDLILNPAELEMRNWSQNDYNAFWLDVVANFASEVVASPGWAWSNGARFEVAAALYYSKPVVDLDGRERKPDELMREAEAAAAAVHSLVGSRDGAAETLVAFDVGHVPLLSSAQTQAFDWLQVERSYQLKKFGTAADDEHTQEGIGPDGWWQQQLDNYLHRARLLGVDRPNGRQALAKFTATALGMLESVIRVYGPLPEPGVSSGEIKIVHEPCDAKATT